MTFFDLFCFALLLKWGKIKKDLVLQTEKSVRFCVLEILENPGGNKEMSTCCFSPSQARLLKKKKKFYSTGFLWDVRNKIVIKKKHLLPFFVINFRKQNSYSYYLAPALNLFRTSFISSMSSLPCLFFYLAVWGLCCNVWDL